MIWRPKRTMRRLGTALIAIAAPLAAAVAQQPNILLLIADDLGTESLASYGIGDQTAITPNIDRLAESGVQFEGFWSQPVCSPTRAAMLTGRYAYRTGVRSALRFQWAHMDAPALVAPAFATKELAYSPRGLQANGEVIAAAPLPNAAARTRGPSTSELMLPQILRSLRTPYATAAIGKWHLADLINGSLEHPNDSGFDYFSGPLFGGPSSFFSWRHTENGELTATQGYADERLTNDAIQWINEQGDQPWFAWLAYMNPHTPVHLPPARLLNSDAATLDPDGVNGNNNQAYFFAQIEALDTLIGRLLESIPADTLANTYVVFVGDNGTVNWDMPPAPRDPDRVKATVYEGGVNVPLIVTGPGIGAGRVVRPLGHVVDLFATIIELVGGAMSDLVPDAIETDSVSLTPYLFDAPHPNPRSWVLTEITMGPTVANAIRDDRYKLVVINDREEFYDLRDDPNELDALAIERLDGRAMSSYQSLKSKFAEIRSTVPVTATPSQ